MDGSQEAFTSLRALMAAGDRGLDLIRQIVARATASGDLLVHSQVRLLCPLGRPTLIRDFATMDSHMRNYLLLRATERGRGNPDPQAHLEAERRAGRFSRRTSFSCSGQYESIRPERLTSRGWSHPSHRQVVSFIAVTRLPPR